MNPPIPRRIVYSAIDRSIFDLDALKDEILNDIPYYASMHSGIIPTNPEGGYTVLFIIHNDLEVSNKVGNDILQILRKYMKKEEISDEV